MMRYHVGYSKLGRRGQLKIQQTAFVLVAIMIFFAMATVFYFSIRISSLQSSALDLKDDQARETLKKIASSPEFSFSLEDCSNCVDFDKVLLLSEKRSYIGFWDFDYLIVEKLYPEPEDRKCTRETYPNCKDLVIINKTKDFGTVSSAFVSLCRYESANGSYFKCELGRILASGEGIKDED